MIAAILQFAAVCIAAIALLIWHQPRTLQRLARILERCFWRIRVRAYAKHQPERAYYAALVRFGVGR